MLSTTSLAPFGAPTFVSFSGVLTLYFSKKSPIVLLQERSAVLDKAAGRAPLEAEDIVGYKHIGTYYRQNPGCPEYLGLRVNSSTWISEEKVQLLLDYLQRHPRVCKALQNRKDNDLAYGMHYIKARNRLEKAAMQTRDGLKALQAKMAEQGESLCGSWDDHVERLEFYREHTLFSAGSPRLYNVVADRLSSKESPLRKHADSAYLYYTLARVSIENDEIMQDGQERALNKVFADLKVKRHTDRAHVETVFSLQQAVLDGLDYLEENRRELPIWGIPPFENHHVQFHPNHAPPPEIQVLIQKEMDIVDKDFEAIIRHWRSPKDKVARHLDVLIQFRVLEQQELAIKQRDMAVQRQNLAVIEAKNSRAQARSVLVFTAITIIFMPLSFFTEYFGMTSSQKYNPRYFWLVSGPISACIIVVVFVLARWMRNVKEADLEVGITKKDGEWRELARKWVTGSLSFGEKRS